MKTVKKIGMLLFSIWLVLWGARALFSLQYYHLNLLINILGFVAGLLLLWSVLADWQSKGAA